MESQCLQRKVWKYAWYREYATHKENLEKKACVVVLIKSGHVLRFSSLFARLLKWQYKDIIIGLPSENYRHLAMKGKHHRDHKPRCLRSQTKVLAEVRDMSEQRKPSGDCGHQVCVHLL